MLSGGFCETVGAPLNKYGDVASSIPSPVHPLAIMSSSVFEAWGNSQQSCSAQNASDSSFKPQILAAIKEVSPAYRWPIGLIIVFTSTFVVFNLLQHLKNPLRDVPGPWMAKFSRLWLMRAYASRSFQQINRDLHRKHGKMSLCKLGSGCWTRIPSRN